MKITKRAHSCLLVEEKGVRILADPGGTYFTLPDDLSDIDIILITHVHSDHYDQEALNKVLRKSPAAKIFTNNGVGASLSKANTRYSLLEGGGSVREKNVRIEAFGDEHALLLPGVPVVANTGYLIADRLFLPGDAFTAPSKPVEILALAVAAPWLKLSEAVGYAEAVKPKICFPVHEAILKDAMVNIVTTAPQKSIQAFGAEFVNIAPGKTLEV
jgi:L-ascorbate metabolism protein UlaG (beta-lactamase superfamily)